MDGAVARTHITRDLSQPLVAASGDALPDGRSRNRRGVVPLPAVNDGDAEAHTYLITPTKRSTTSKSSNAVNFMGWWL